MTVLRLKTWYALWGWKEWIQHVQGDSTVIVFDLGECIWKQKEWKNVKRRNCKLYDHFLNWTDLPCDTRDPVWWCQWYLWNDGMQFWYVAPWPFSNLGNLTGAARGRMRDRTSMAITDEIPVWSLGCSRSTAVFIVVELVWSKKAFLQVELGVLSAMKGSEK